MKVLALTNKPSYYQVPIFRGLSEKLGENFILLVGNKGQAEGCFEKSWGTTLKNDFDLLSGYKSYSLDLDEDQISRRLPDHKKAEIARFLQQTYPSVVFTNCLRGAFCRYVLKQAKKIGAIVIVRSTPNDLGERPWWKIVLRTIW